MSTLVAIGCLALLILFLTVDTLFYYWADWPGGRPPRGWPALIPGAGCYALLRYGRMK